MAAPGGPVSRVLYPDGVGTVTISLALSATFRRRYPDPQAGTMLPLGSSSLPGDGPGTLGPPIRPCSRWGLTTAASPRPVVSSYLTFSPLSRLVSTTHRDGMVSVPLSVPLCPKASRPWALPSTLPGGARTFLPHPNILGWQRSPGPPDASTPYCSTSTQAHQR